MLWLFCPHPLGHRRYLKKNIIKHFLSSPTTRHLLMTRLSRSYGINLFTAIIYICSNPQEFLSPVKPVMIVSKSEAYLSETPLRCSTQGRLLASLTNIRRGWRGLPGKLITNIRHSAIKGQCYKTFYGRKLRLSIIS